MGKKQQGHVGAGEHERKPPDAETRRLEDTEKDHDRHSGNRRSGRDYPESNLNSCSFKSGSFNRDEGDKGDLKLFL